MHPTDLTVAQLFDALQGKLWWCWAAGLQGCSNQFNHDAVLQAHSSVDLVGYLSHLHPHRVTVLGEREIAYLCDQKGLALQHELNRIMALTPPFIVVADAQKVPNDLSFLCEANAVPLVSTNESAAYVIDVLRSKLSKCFAQKTSMHGVFMDIFGMGVLLQGESGLGKSELGLELISRGHGLIADDVVDFSLIAQGVIEGRCPKLLANMLEVRGIGLLNIRTIFGEMAMRHKMRLRLIVRLLPRGVWERDFERLPTESLGQEVLGVPIREVIIPVEAGRNIAVLVEAAVRNTILQMQGIDSYKEFLLRQQQAMQDDKDAFEIS